MGDVAKVIGGMQAESSGKSMHPYQHGRFVALLPVDYGYTSSHVWMECRGGDLWRVGWTRFATRMLGEVVDHGFDVEPGQPIEQGQVLGWVEGFKAISDLFSVIQGIWVRANPVLMERVHLISKDPHETGWLYEATGSPGMGCLDVRAYAAVLDRCIDRILEKRSRSSEV